MDESMSTSTPPPQPQPAAAAVPAQSATSQACGKNPAIFTALFFGHSLVKQLAEKAYELGQPGLNCDQQFTVMYHR